MPKLQQIERKNGSVVSSVNIPLDIIEEYGLKKGDELSIEMDYIGAEPRIIIVRSM